MNGFEGLRKPAEIAGKKTEVLPVGLGALYPIKSMYIDV